MNAAFLANLPETIDPKSLETIFTSIQQVEEELKSQLCSQVELVQEVGHHTLSAGGKRLRPALVTLSAIATGLPFEQARTVKLGACMELIHMATLIHDDVIDRADLRRGIPTASSVFGNTASILSGDVLLAKAMRILALDGDLDIIRRVSSVVVDLAEGEVRELELRGNAVISKDAHFDVLRRKTATFIEACCEIGGACAGSTPEVRKALGSFGHHIGLAFQIVDDLLDYRGDHAATGKMVATDFREGCSTLPLIFLLPHLTAEETAFVQTKFGNGVTDADLAMITGWMDVRGSFAECEAEADAHIGAAKSALDILPDGSAKALLSAVADFVGARDA